MASGKKEGWDRGCGKGGGRSKASIEAVSKAAKRSSALRILLAEIDLLIYPSISSGSTLFNDI